MVTRTMSRSVLLPVLLLFASAALARPPELATLGAEPQLGGPITLNVDLREAPRKIFRVRESIPARGGPLTLYYPKWIPGEHMPSGTIDGVTGLKINAGGKPLSWRRDLDDPFVLHLEVPSGSNAVEVDFQFLSPAERGGSGAGVSASPRLVVLEWNQVLFYPAGYPVRNIQVTPAARLPENWNYGTSLEAQGPAAVDYPHFKTLSLEALVDSPLAAGLNFRRIELARVGSRPVTLDLVGDRSEDLVASDEQIRQQRALVEQAAILFGDHHFDRYHFLLALSDGLDHYGLEHQQSSDNRLPPDFFTDKSLYLAAAALLPHEYLHAWNGKFRRPEGLATPNFNLPMRGELLWVYEGLTEYYGEVLTARAGLYTPEQFRDVIACDAAMQQTRPGRAWRSLQDTADSASVLYAAPNAWANYRRDTDFYEEGLLIWLDVDTLIRELSGGKRSLDDFMKAFFGLPDDRRTVVPYRFDDVVDALNKVQPYEWSRFLRERLDSDEPEAPIEGVVRAGWKLSYSDSASDYFKAVEARRKRVDLMFSVGLRIDDDENKGRLIDVLWGGPGFSAGLVPGMQIVAVDGMSYTPERLRDSIRTADDERAPIELLVRQQEIYSTVKLDYHDGLRYPKLVRAITSSDRLASIGRPRK